jgi:hypothetical protein
VDLNYIPTKCKVNTVSVMNLFYPFYLHDLFSICSNMHPLKASQQGQPAGGNSLQTSSCVLLSGSRTGRVLEL